MSNLINYNEVRRLAAKIGKTRPILSCIKIESGKAYFTNSAYLLVMEGYNECEDGLMFMDNYKRPIGSYPDLSLILNRQYHYIEFEKTILNNEVVYKIGGYYIDNEILTQIKKLVAIKNFTVDVNAIKASGSTLRLDLPDNSFIMFCPKRWRE